MDKSLRILRLLSRAVVEINNGILIQNNKKNTLEQQRKDFTYGEKMLYFDREYLSSNNFIDGSACLIRTILLINGIEFDPKANLYDLWRMLSLEEQISLSTEAFRRYTEMHEVRAESRNPDIGIIELSEPLNERNIDSNLRRSIELISERNERSNNTPPDTDFLSKFSVGVVRHFVTRYLFAGILMDIQKSRKGDEIFGGLKSIVNADDAKHKEIMEYYRRYTGGNVRMHGEKR